MGEEPMTHLMELSTGAEGKVFIYVLTDPRGTPEAYVGCTKNPRARYKKFSVLADIKSATTGHRLSKWLTSLNHTGYLPNMTILDECDKEEAFHAEQDAIAIVRAARGDALVNSNIRRGYRSYR